MLLFLIKFIELIEIYTEFNLSLISTVAFHHHFSFLTLEI